jgi:hypothetical protein
MHALRAVPHTPSASVLRPSGSTATPTNDAYGGLLSELQNVRSTITQYVDPGQGTTADPHDLLPATNSQERSRHVRSVSPSTPVAPSASFNPPPPQPANTTKATRLKSRRSKKVKEYRERFLEEREVLLTDLEQRLSRDAARQARGTLNSSLRPNDVDAMARDSARLRGSKLSNLTNEFVVETQDALRAMRERLENEQARALASVHGAFEEDKERLLSELETTGRLEKEEAMRMLMEEHRAEKERLIGEENRRARDDMNRELARMKAQLNVQLNRPASELVLEDDRFKELAEEEVRLRETLDHERKALASKLKDQLDLQIKEQRAKMMDEHRDRVEALTLDVLHTHEVYLKNERKRILGEQQQEQETVLKELGEALRYGTQTSLEKYSHDHDSETDKKCEALRAHLKDHERGEIEKLRRRLKQDSEKQMRQVRQEAASNLEIETAKLMAEMKSDHASRMHKLQLDLKSQRDRSMVRAKKQAEEAFRAKVDSMKLAMENDIDEATAEYKIGRMEELKKTLQTKIESGKRTERIALAAIRERFQEEADNAFQYIDEYFRIVNRPIDVPHLDVDVPRTKDEMRSRLNSLRRQFDTFMRRYELAGEKLGEMQNDLVSAQLDAARKERLVEELRNRATGHDMLEINARKLYLANEHLMDQVNMNKRVRESGGDRRQGNIIN